MWVGGGKARGVLLIVAALAVAAGLWTQAEAQGQRTRQDLKSEPPGSGEPVKAVSQATVTRTGEIAGVVTDAGTGKPISRARVMLFAPLPPWPSIGGVPPIFLQYPCTECASVGPLRYQTTTDPQGRYRIQVAAPGRYAVQAAANGFAQQAYAMSKTGGDDGILEARPGEQKENVDIQLPRAAVLTGRVTDKRGEAIPSAYLLLEWYGFPASVQKSWRPVTMMVTDDRGIYHVFGLAAGRYRIKMRYERGLQLSTNVPGNLGYTLLFNRYSLGALPRSFSPLYYYPGVTEADQAKTLTLEAGEVRRGVNMSVVAARPTAPIAANECGVSGTVTDVKTGKALGNAWVSWGFTRAYEQPGWYETLTDAEGRFALRGLPCLVHAPLRAWKAGYLPATYSPEQIYGPRPWRPWLGLPHFPTWNIGMVRNLRLELTPEGAITGRITDSQGKPEALVGVEAVRWLRPIGSLSYLSECCEALTDENGEYRIFGLAPGQYYVAAQFFERGTASQEPHAPVEEPYLTPLARMQAQAGLHSETHPYYPGWVKRDEASPIRLGTGETVKGINFTGEPPETYSISGVVRGYARNAFERYLRVFLQATPAAPKVHYPAETWPAISPSGKFRIEGVLPGAYVVWAQMYKGNTQWTAWASLTVTHKNVSGVVLDPNPGWTIEGDLKIEGGPKEKYRHAITAQPVGSLYSRIGLSTTTLLGSGKFDLKGIIPGQYEIEVRGGLRDNYLKAATFGSQDVRTGFLMVGTHAPKGTLHLTVSRNGAVIEGKVMNAAGEPARDAKVVLVPENRPRGAYWLLRTAETFGQGCYLIGGVAPGKYRVVAMRIGAGKPWLQQELLRKGMASGRSVEVKEGEKKTVDVRETE